MNIEEKAQVELAVWKEIHDLYWTGGINIHLINDRIFNLETVIKIEESTHED